MRGQPKQNPTPRASVHFTRYTLDKVSEFQWLRVRTCKVQCCDESVGMLVDYKHYLGNHQAEDSKGNVVCRWRSELN